MTKDLYIRSSTAEYLIFSAQSEADGIEVRYEDGTLWLTESEYETYRIVQDRLYKSDFDLLMEEEAEYLR